MATYKVPQDVEAEDKLLGPFTFKQLIFLLIAGFLGFFMFLLAKVHIFLIAIPLPFFLVFLFFGVFRRKDQPVESYVAALLRFYIKPRRRVWDKDGVMETVHITAPKKEVGPAIEVLSGAEVSNRLNVLGQLMDTRGWSAKNASLQDGGGAAAATLVQSDRLVAPQLAQEPAEVHQYEDVLNEQANPVAQSIAQKTDNMQATAQTMAIQNMQSQGGTYDKELPVDPNEIKYTPHPTMNQSVVHPVDDTSPQSSSQQATSVDDNNSAVDNTNQPASDDNNTEEESKSSSGMTTDVSPDIIKLSNNNDRTIESLGKEADEVLHSGQEISLHG